MVALPAPFLVDPERLTVEGRAIGSDDPVSRRRDGRLALLRPFTAVVAVSAPW